MESLRFKDIEDFAFYIADVFEDVHEMDCDNDITIIAKYDEAKKIIEELIRLEYGIASLDIHDEMVSGYSDEYAITLTNFDRGLELWCEPMKTEDGYLLIDPTVTFIFGNCSHKVIKNCKGSYVIEVDIVGEDDEDACGWCEDCCTLCDLAQAKMPGKSSDTKSSDTNELSKDKKNDETKKAEIKAENALESHIGYTKDEDDNMHGFTASRSTDNAVYTYSFYTSDKLSDDMIRAMLKDFGF